MKIEVIGCHGGEGPEFHATSFLLNGNTLVDAGSAVGGLSMERQKQIDHVVITHPHLDHVKDLAFLADNTFGTRDTPIQVVSDADVITDLRDHLFNWIIWPDFSVLPTPEKPTMVWAPIKDRLQVGDLIFESHDVNHPGNAVGYVIEDPKADVSVLISGDTQSTDAIWEAGFKRKNLAAIFVDIAFPNDMAHIAARSGHFTPAMFKEEMKKFPDHSIPIFVYHLKPAFYKTVEQEIAALEGGNFTVVREGEIFEFGCRAAA